MEAHSCATGRVITAFESLVGSTRADYRLALWMSESEDQAHPAVSKSTYPPASTNQDGSQKRPLAPVF